MENKILKKFEATDVTIEVIDGVPMFELYSTGMALGYVKTAKGKQYARNERIDKIVQNAGITTVVHDNNKYINIDDVRKFISLSHTNNITKENFIKYLSDKGLLEYHEVFASNRKELKFLNELEEILAPLNIKGIHQYAILTYRIDFYIPSLKLAIEYDENDHSSYSYENHELRQYIIEQELGCKFVRLSDSKNNFYNIGIVMSKIWEVLNGNKIQEQTVCA